MKNSSNLKEKGITLVALVITIIILLILAGISISALTNTGIFGKAKEAKAKTEKASIIEQAQTDVLEKQAKKRDTELAKEELRIILDKYFKDIPENYTTETILTTNEKYGNYEISVSDIYAGNLKSNILKTESYVGYYADFEGDGTIDGIIYADLAVGGSGTWNSKSWSSYSYSAETGLKDYYISKTGYEGKFGTKDVLTSTRTGKDRFYVMALEDFNPGIYYCWYDAAYGKLDNLVATEFNDFGQGKTNTTTMIAEWNKGENGKYGAQDDNGTYKDMWGVIQKADSAGKTWDLSKWFVPSKAEWAAFGDFLYTKLGVTTGNYGNYGLKNYYWSSARYNTDNAYGASFRSCYMGCSNVDNHQYVRLSATF